MDVMTFIAVLLGEFVFLFSVALIGASLDKLAAAKVEAAKVQWPGVVQRGPDKSTGT